MEFLADIQIASHGSVVVTMLELSIMIEEKISAYMKGKKGSLMHDGWIRHGTNFVALISYCVINWGVIEEVNKIDKPEITLIS